MTGKAFKEKKVEDIRLTVEPNVVVSELESSLDAVPSEQSIVHPVPDLGERYQVLGQIGSGGMGTVWKVHDLSLDQTLAIKILHPEMFKDSTAVKRFEQEARLATDLTHANIATIYGPGKDVAGHPFIIMNYIDGESLAAILAREGKLDQDRALDIYHQICAALSHSHMKGIVHRDIKPSNIVISKTPSGADLVHVVDFGIAKSVYGDVQSTQALTKTDDTCGSPLYMSPEQCLGEEVTARSDIYSLGCVLYEMLTGAPPFKDKNPVKLILQHLHGKPDFSQVPERLWALVFICLQKEQKSRPESIEDLLVYESGHGANGDFNGVPRSCDWLAVVSVFAVIITLPTIATHLSHPANSFLIISVLYVVFLLFWLTLAIANCQTVIRSSTVRLLEQALFVALVAVPALTTINFVTRNSFEGFAYLVVVALSGLSLATLRKDDLYARLFFWRHPKSFVHRIETRLVEMFAAVARISAFAIFGISIFCLVFSAYISQLCADIAPRTEFLPSFLLPIISVIIWFLADLTTRDRGVFLAVTVRKSFVKAGRLFATYFSIVIIVTVGLIATLWSPTYTLLLRENASWQMVSPATLKVQQEAAGAPHTVIGDLARTWAVKGLLFRGDKSFVPGQLAAQVLNNGSDSSPEVRAASYLQLAQLATHRDASAEWAQYFDKALEELKKPEERFKNFNAIDSLMYQNFMMPKSGTAVALAYLAFHNKDSTRLQQVRDFLDNAKLPINAIDRDSLERIRIPANLPSKNGSLR